MFEARLDESVNRKGVHLENKREEVFVLKYNKIFCTIYEGIEVAYATMSQHCAGIRHQKKKILFAGKEARKNDLLGRVDGYAKYQMIAGQSASTELKAYNVEVLEKMCTSNASAATFQNMVPFIDHNSVEGKRIGNVQDFADRWRLFLYSDLFERNQKMVSDDGCFPCVLVRRSEEHTDPYYKSVCS